jgi:hypothetical protein
MPIQIGQPCWDAAQIAKVISLNAQTNTEAVDYFLAAHSPFRFVANFRNPGVALTEEQVFQDIFAPERGEVLAAVKGEPGTGKSHLVHWLKLRTDFSVQSGDARFANTVRVLVQRGNGSLKDSLRQIVQQLGPDFKDQIARVQGAIDKLSAETARATLLAKLALEIDYHWTERGRPPLPKCLRDLGQALKSKGVGRWLLREGGTIDRVIKRLAETSTIKQREEENFPAFQVEELDPKPTFLSLSENSKEVRAFFGDMEMEPKLREEAVLALNTAMRDAVKELVGLSKDTLQEVFFEIRRKLGRKKTLALFVEDVSVTGLDRDVINALEPQARNDLCRLVAVIGITSNAWGRLEQAQMERVSPVFEIGAQMTQRWASDPEEVMRFTARYLNAIRLDDAEIGELARARFDGDVSHSRCSECPVRKECHGVFGSVSFADGVEVGMFPFSQRAPHALLAGLRESGDTTGVARSQRGLLENVLRPILQDSRTALEEKEFPKTDAISVQPVPLPDWDRLANGWLGGAAWDEFAKRRLRMLAEFWVSSGDAEDLASRLHPFLKPLGFPAFAKSVKKTEQKRDEKKEDQKKEEKRDVDPNLARLLTALEDWHRGEDLQRDNLFRELLSSFITRAIRWEDERDVPFQEFKKRVDTTAFPFISGQKANPATQAYFFKLPKNKETFAILSALVQFKYKGGGSWNYPGAELHKRTMSQWLRKHRQEVVSVTAPTAPLNRLDAVRTAAELMGLASVLRDRKPLPDDDTEAMKRLFLPIWEEGTRPVTFSVEMRELVTDLEKRYAKLRDLVIQEAGIGQGRVDPKDFVDPRPFLDAIRHLNEQLGVKTLPAVFTEGAFKSRFYDVANLSVYQNLPQRLEAEREAIAERVAAVADAIKKGGCEAKALDSGLREWLRAFTEVTELQRGRRGRDAVLPHPNPPFDELWEQGVFRKRAEVWETALRRASEVAKSDAKEVLEFDPTTLAELHESLEIADRHIHQVEKVLAGVEQELDRQGGGNCSALLAELHGFPFAEAPSSGTAPEDND